MPAEQSSEHVWWLPPADEDAEYFLNAFGHS
jgi:hypothetical protein